MRIHASRPGNQLCQSELASDDHGAALGTNLVTSTQPEGLKGWSSVVLPGVHYWYTGIPISLLCCSCTLFCLLCIPMSSFALFFLLLWAGAHQVVRLGEAAAETLLSHLPVSQAAGAHPAAPSSLSTASMAEHMGATWISDLVAADKSSSVNLCSCDTGEPLPAKLATKIQQGLFMELHEFLPKPMMETSKARVDLACMCCHNRPAAQQRSTRSIGNIFTRVIGYNRYVAAVATLRPSRVASLLAHANTIVQAAQMFEEDGWREYDRAVGLQAVTTTNEDWGALNLPLYARTFVAAKRRRNVCRFCCSHNHTSSQCPWGGGHTCVSSLTKYYQDHRRVDCPRKTTPGHTKARRPAPWPPEAKRPAP